MKRCSLVMLALLLFAVCSTTVLAANREIKFYVSNDFIGADGFRGADETTLKNRLATYVQHMNAILAKNTDLQLTYNPTSTVFVTQELAKPPHSPVRPKNDSQARLRIFTLRSISPSYPMRRPPADAKSALPMTSLPG